MEVHEPLSIIYNKKESTFRGVDVKGFYLLQY